MHKKLNVIASLVIIIVISTFLHLGYARVDVKNQNIPKLNQTPSTDKNDSYKREKEIIMSLIGNTGAPIEEDEDEVDSDINTNVYKSTDPSSDLVEEQSNLDVTSDDDIISKYELLNKPGKHKMKIKKKKIDNTSQSEPNNYQSHSSIFPWLVLVFLIVLLVFIFKYLFRTAK